jgi:hypothetical protein
MDALIKGPVSSVVQLGASALPIVLTAAITSRVQQPASAVTAGNEKAASAECFPYAGPVRTSARADMFGDSAPRSRGRYPIPAQVLRSPKFGLRC